MDCAVSIMRRATDGDEGGPAHRLRIGMGIHVGEAVPHDGQFVGIAVNIAARLAAKADAGEILVTDAVRRPRPVRSGLAGLRSQYTHRVRA